MRVFTSLVLALVLSLTVTPLLAVDSGNGLKECRALERAGKFEEALAKYLELIKAAPSDELYREAGSLLGKLQRYDEADVLLKEATKAFPRSTPLLNMEALIAHRKGRTDEARSVWNKVLEIDSSNTFAREWIAKLNRTGVASTTEVPPAATVQTEPVQEIPASATTAGLREATASASSEKSIEGKNGTGLNGDTPLSPEEQEKLAKKLYEEMVSLDKWETAKFEELHRQVIEKCPATDHAIESCWRISNLYLMADDQPRYEDVIRVLEHLVTKYPNSQIVPDAKNRLLLAYKNGGHPDKVVTMYQDLFKINPAPDDRTFMIWALEYANALSAVGKPDDAKKLYEQVIEKDGGKDQLEARVARDKLGRKE